ncbi:GntR family transcriptional regulator [Methylobrevis pamukkalensis]|uniref:Putative HTH-type transcriptional regulator YdfH n=1 Tax=Methylobrevis pamukkalensis TaxID=1439726 RepID=A0A1E3GWM5_9HYPH|nr:GntR family transcriptional regulator [Methylobrevis pamukkalensis]ODN68450.1 putative HTH-type transcriptional regulator YdfH [Methylobrevis pamukkalensis]
MSPQAVDIESFILTAVLGGRLRPGTRLGEMQLAELFRVSRTKVREALVRLETRGIVTVSPRRGWYVVEPSAEEAQEAFHARKIVETGLLLAAGRIAPEAIAALKHHLEVERRSLDGDDISARTCLLGDFHIHLADLLGNRLVTEVVRDLTARTTLISMLYQPKDKAEESSHDHADIVAALERGDFAAAAALMSAHIDHVEAGLDLSARPDPLAGLRDAFFLDPDAAAPPDPQPASPAPSPYPDQHGDNDP